MLRICLLLPVLLLAACNSGIYLRDGVTDGDTFYLAQRALVDDDPVLQSWVSYSLSLSACKLSIGGENPARASSFDCELLARRHLLDTWQEKGSKDRYLDELLQIREQDLLPEYVAHYLYRDGWTLPADLQPDAFEDFVRNNFPRHRAKTRITGSWNYARNVRLQQH